MQKITKSALINALATTGYIILVVSFFFFAGESQWGEDNEFLIPIAMLMLFVTSAAITGYLMVGKPLLMYLDGKKKEAITLLTQTIGFFAAFTVLAILSLVVFTR